MSTELDQRLDTLTPDQIRQLYKTLLQDTSNTDTHIRAVARHVLSPKWLDDPIVGRPTLEWITDALVQEIIDLRLSRELDKADRLLQRGREERRDG